MTDAARFKSRPVESPIEAQRSNSTPVEALEKAKGGISRPRSLTSSPQTEVIKITLSKSRATGDRSAGLSIGVPTEHTMSEHTQQTATQDDAQFQITESDLKADLRRVKLELGETPSYGDYDQHGAYSFTPIRRVFGCWSNALAAVGFDTNDRAANAAYTDEELLDAIRELAAEVEGAPTARDMNNHGRHSNQIYYNRFGSWTAALSKAGVEKKDNYVSAGV